MSELVTVDRTNTRTYIRPTIIHFGRAAKLVRTSGSFAFDAKCQRQC